MYLGHFFPLRGPCWMSLVDDSCFLMKSQKVPQHCVPKGLHEPLFAIMLQRHFVTLTSEGHFNGPWAELSSLPGERALAVMWAPGYTPHLPARPSNRLNSDLAAKRPLSLRSSQRRMHLTFARRDGLNDLQRAARSLPGGPSGI